MWGPWRWGSALFWLFAQCSVVVIQCWLLARQLNVSTLLNTVSAGGGALFIHTLTHSHSCSLCLLAAGTGLYELWKAGLYRNYHPDRLVDLVAR